MAEPFLSEIRMFGFGWPPRGWAECDGQILSINQNQSLYSLLGTAYGGDGRTSFALPNMRSRTPIGEFSNLDFGKHGGTEYVTLTSAQMPTHTHTVNATTTPGDQRTFEGNVLAAGVDATTNAPINIYTAPTSLVPLASRSLSSAGGSQAHNNCQPLLVVNFCIALQGVFPSRN